MVEIYLNPFLAERRDGIPVIQFFGVFLVGRWRVPANTGDNEQDNFFEINEFELQSRYYIHAWV